MSTHTGGGVGARTNRHGEPIALQTFTCGHNGEAFFTNTDDRPCGDCRDDARRMNGEGGHPEVAFN